MPCRHSHVHIHSGKEITICHFPVRRRNVVVRLERYAGQRHRVVVRGCEQSVWGSYTDGHLFNLPIWGNHSFAHRGDTSVYRDGFPVCRNHLPVCRYVFDIRGQRFPMRRDEFVVCRDDFPVCRRDTDGRKLRTVVRRSDVGARRRATSVRRSYTSVRRRRICVRVLQRVFNPRQNPRCNQLARTSLQLTVFAL